MGIIRAAIDAVGGGLRDQWLEVIEPDDMGERTVFTKGVVVRTDGKKNNKGGKNVISNGSVIHVYPNQCMLLLDGGKIVDYSAEEGYYTVSDVGQPSFFNGDMEKVADDLLNRVRYAGGTPRAQQVFYINLQEIKGIKFGTRTPINYFDNFYNSELFLRTHGSYSIRITDPIRFYAEVIPRNAERVEIESVNEQYLNEFLEALQAAINQLSVDGVRISHVASKGRELSRYMSKILDEDWTASRGMEIQSVGIASISYDDESQKLINMRNQGAMLGDPGVREGYVQGAAARGIEAAGSNKGGSANAFIGMNMANNVAGGFVAGSSRTNSEQAAQQPKPDAQGWQCECGARSSGKFCSECGKPEPKAKFCPECGAKAEGGRFCSACGAKL